MITFDWTFKSWDKIRPALLPKTGFGAALKKYESKKAILEQSGLDSSNYIDTFQTAMDELNKAAALYEKAIGACGTNPLFKSAKASLEASKPQAEENILANLLKLHLAGRLKVIGPKIAETVQDARSREEKITQLSNELDQLIKTAQKENWDQRAKNSHGAELEKALRPILSTSEVVMGNRTTADVQFLSQLKAKKNLLKKYAAKSMESWDKFLEVYNHIQEKSGEDKVKLNELSKKWREYSKAGD
jgi:uncharacterized protein YciI